MDNQPPFRQDLTHTNLNNINKDKLPLKVKTTVTFGAASQ